MKKSFVLLSLSLLCLCSCAPTPNKESKQDNSSKQDVPSQVVEDKPINVFVLPYTKIISDFGQFVNPFGASILYT